MIHLKHLKTYEKLNTPKIGDYVILYANYNCWLEKYAKFFDSGNIGKIVDVDYSDKVFHHYKVFFDFPWLSSGKIYCSNSQIKYFGTKEECELFLQSEKYNI